MGQGSFQACEMTDGLFACGEQGGGPFQLQRWSCLPSDSNAACGDARGDCVHHLHLQIQVSHQTKDMPLQSSVHSESNNRMVTHCPSFCKIPWNVEILINIKKTKRLAHQICTCTCCQKSGHNSVIDKRNMTVIQNSVAPKIITKAIEQAGH